MTWIKSLTRWTSPGENLCDHDVLTHCRLTSEKPRIIVEINDNTGFIPSFLSESN